ncbi:MAG: sodium:solute symporter family protein [Acidobacteria bacterium]|nr:sodium:solute symporter family protein [Acidobacteriota bacterium]
MNTAAIIVLILYGLVLVGVGLWASRRVHRAEDFYVAGRRLGPGLLAATVLAANIGSGTTVGVAGLAYDIGAAAVWWTGSAVLGTLVLALTVGPRMWRVARDLECLTVGDYLEIRFGGALRSIVMGFLWFGSVLILMSQIVAIGYVVEAFSGVGLSYGIVLGGGVVLVYYAAGGLWSSAVVNVVQLAVKLVAFPVALLAASRVLGGFEALRGTAETMGAEYLSPLSIGGLGIAGYVTVLGTSFVISPGLLQKAFGARDESAVRQGLLLSTVGLAGFAFIPVAMGILARSYWPVPLSLENSGWVLPQMLVEILPPAVGLLALAAVVSAELSSADAVLFMLSTSMARDFYQRFWNPDVDDAGLLRAGRIAAIVGLSASVLIALPFPSILGGLSAFYTILVVVLAVPLIAGLYWPRADHAATLASVAASVTVWLLALWWTGEVPGPGNLWPSLLGIIAGATVCVIVTLRPAAHR